MTNDRGIFIKNIYYMLAYAFQVLKQSNYEDLAVEEFSNVHDLFAAILAKGISRQLKQGLYREYIPIKEDMNVMRGKLDIPGTIRNKLQRRRMLNCDYDELSENNLFNQVLKTTATILMHQKSVGEANRSALKRIMLYFHGVDCINPSNIRWSRVQHSKNNQSYEMLMEVCRLVLDGLLLTTEKGEHKLAAFLDEQRMSRLYERFLLEYYKRHHPELNPSSSIIAWKVDDGFTKYLPSMITDIVLESNGRSVIIDAKYYAGTMQRNGQFDSISLYSNNLYQIFAYVKNSDVYGTGNVAGMLLYAKTDENITPDWDYQMSGNRISARTIDLNVPFQMIAAKLDDIASSYFPEHRETRNLFNDFPPENRY